MSGETRPGEDTGTPPGEDTETPSAEGLDLTPRVGPQPVGPKSKRSIRNLVVVSVIAAALGFVLFQALTSARVFFYNVDEAIEQRDQLGQSRIRMQGNVVSEDGVDEVGALLFTVGFGGQTAEVKHVGDEPSDLFELGEAVVVEGHWEGEVFVSRQVLVKHSEEYVEDNPKRFDQT